MKLRCLLFGHKYIKIHEYELPDEPQQYGYSEYIKGFKCCYCGKWGKE